MARLSVNIGDEAKTFLLDKMASRNTDTTEQVRRALSVLKMVYDTEESGKRLLIEDRNGKLYDVKFLW